MLLAARNAALVDIHPDDLRAAPSVAPGSIADYAMAIHRAASRDEAREMLAQVRNRVLAALASEGAPVAWDAFEAVDVLIRCVEQGWDNVAGVAGAVAAALEATGPLTPTADGQHVRMLLSALVEATAQRRPVGFVRARGGAA